MSISNIVGTIFLKYIQKEEFQIRSKDRWRYIITAELRVDPIVSIELGLFSYDKRVVIAKNLVRAKLTTLFEGYESDGSYYLYKYYTKQYIPGSTKLSTIYKELEKEQTQLQVEFTKLMDQAIIADKLNKLNQ